MATDRKTGGYIWRQEIARAIAANNTAREALQRILDDRPGPAATAMYMAQAAIALGDNMDALHALRTIGADNA